MIVNYICLYQYKNRLLSISLVGNVELLKAIKHQLITYRRGYIYFPCSAISHIPIGYHIMGSMAYLFWY